MTFFEIKTRSVGAFDLAGGGGSSVSPALIQHISSFTNLPFIQGVPSSIYTVPIGSPVGTGNCIVIGCSYPLGNPPTITDNNGNSWPASPNVSVSGSSTTTAIFILANAHAGQTVLTFTFGGGAAIPFEYKISEFCGVALASPVNGTKTAGSVSSPTVAVGSFTPTTNNDVNGGNLIWAYFGTDGLLSASTPTDWVPGGSFTLLDGTIDTQAQSWPSSSQWWLQTTQAAVNPSVTTTGDTTDSWNCVAVALKVANAGTAMPAGIRMVKLLHMSPGFQGSGTMTLKCPTTGNLRMVSVASPNIAISSVTDSDGGTYTDVANSAVNTGGYLWVCANRSPNPNLIVSIAYSGASGDSTSVRFYDIKGAAASPVDVVTTTSNGGVVGVGNVATDCPPAMTPTQANGLAIAVVATGTGPVFTCTSQVADMCTGNDQTDSDAMENADGLAHSYYSSTATFHWNWTVNTAIWGAAVAFKHA